MARLLAPILAFTAEEIWSALPDVESKAVSVHLTQLPEADPAHMDAVLNEKWEKLITLRGEISKAIEIARQNKVVGHSLDAAVELTSPAALRPFLESYMEDIKTLSIVSDIRISHGDGLKDAYKSSEFEGLTIGVAKAPGEKCNRCWNYSESVGRDVKHPDVCERCSKNLDEITG
jgi:isoleucyl-tRNA synthetase